MNRAFFRRFDENFLLEVNFIVELKGLETAKVRLLLFESVGIAEGKFYFVFVFLEKIFYCALDFT